MKRIFFLLCWCTQCFGWFAASASAQQAMIVKANQPKATIQPTMWGIFFEDINMAADGGIYAELVKNRSFEFNMPLMGWKEQRKESADGSILVVNRSDKNNPDTRYIKVTNNSSAALLGLSNEGFRGMGILKDKQYDFSVWARQTAGSKIKMHVELVNPRGMIIGSVSVPPATPEWSRLKASFSTSATEPKAQLYIWFEGEGSIDLDMISLFPNDTWKQRPGGLRADLVQLLADLKPGFLRFPGGCIVEGRDLANRYQWKNSVGNTETRKTLINRWNTEFTERSTPDYYQSFGLGFYEYFQLAEDLGAEPLPVLNCGMACQFNTAEVVSIDQLDPYIQDALDLIEFANGSQDSKWGKLRASMGHPAPFNLKFLGIGNEQWGPQYIERYKLFVKSIKEKYPKIKLVSSVGPNPDGDVFKYLNTSMRSLHADLLDEHYYRPPEWFLQNAKRYDRYDRNGPKIFAGEFAAHSSIASGPERKNNWDAALSEAAFMTGLERNADVVWMASYAPLLAHAEGWQWTPDLIWFDNLRSFGTPDYFVQKMFSVNKGNQVVPILLNNEPIEGQQGIYASAATDKQTNELIIKIVNTGSKPLTREIQVEGAKTGDATGTMQVIKSDELDLVNSFDKPTAVSPKDEPVSISNKKISLNLAAYSFAVIRLKIL